MDKDTALIVKKNALLYALYWFYLLVTLVTGIIGRITDTVWIVGILLSAIVPLTLLLFLRKFIRVQMYLNIAVLTTVLIVINIAAVKPNGPYLSNFIFLWLVLLSGSMYQKYSTVLFASAWTIAGQIFVFTMFRDSLLKPLGWTGLASASLFTVVITTFFLLFVKFYDDVRAEEEQAQVRLESANRTAEQELRIAGMIQSRFLAEHIGPIPGFEIRTVYSPALFVGGDFYQYARTGPNHHAVILADISGHGESAAIVTSVMCHLFRTAVEKHRLPSDVLREMSANMYALLKGELYATALMLTLDTASPHLKYCSAGHCPFLIYHCNSGCIETRASTGPPLGLFKDSVFRNGEFSLEPGDALILQTDGLMESANDREELFGLKRVEDIVLANAQNGLDCIAANLTEKASLFRKGQEQADDITLILMNRNR